MKFIDGGVCAAEGFTAAGIHCGVKTNNPNKKDVAMIVSSVDCTASAIFTKNVVKAAPIHVSREHLKNGAARAAIINSGNANACAPNGEKHAEETCAAVGMALGVPAENVVVASTGVIGQELRVGVIIDGIPELVKSLRRDGNQDAAAAIMTTDTTMKECAVETVIGGKTVKLGGMTKGSGMIHPNMGTMLCFVTTDCAISAGMIRSALLETADVSFNRISVDGDTSTNDTFCLMANGLAGNPPITERDSGYEAFKAALTEICVKLAREMAADGEGAKHLITCTVSGAKTEESAEICSKSVISSSLVKAAIFGADANWGRVLCALGYSGVDFDAERVDVTFRSAAGSVAVCEKGRGLNFDEDAAKKVLSEKEVIIDVKMAEGSAQCTCWGCDLTYDYVKINGDYRT